VADLTLAVAERVLGESLDDERHRRLINEFIQTVEVR
jgi:F0F1-type ATP synthase membrane subunit b/b'